MRPARASADSEISTEVCVIGGGPAGATIARKLALLGHRVLLVEKTNNSQNKVGESLPPNILALLETLGVRDRIEKASFVRPNESIVHWSSVPVLSQSSNGNRGFLVNRGRFDQILIEAASETGVHVIREATALRPIFDGTRQHWQIPVRTKSGTLDVTAKYLVIAGGKSSFFGQDRKRQSAPTTIALCGYWRDTDLNYPGAVVETGPEEWFWGAPLPDGTFSAMVFIDSKRKRDAGVGGGNSESFYRSLLAGSSLLRGCLAGRLVGRVRGHDASSYIENNPVSEHLIKVGEACFSIDPLSSQGVQAAMNSALQGSFVVHTILTRPEHAADAMQFYRDRQHEAVSRHHNFAARFYSEAMYNTNKFFRDRAVLSPAPELETRQSTSSLNDDSRLSLSGDVTLVDTPCIVGNIIQNTPALTYPGAERPIAYLNNVKIALLLDLIPRGGTAAEIVKTWSPHMSAADSRDIIRSLYEIGVLVGQ